MYRYIPSSAVHALARFLSSSITDFQEGVLP